MKTRSPPATTESSHAPATMSIPAVPGRPCRLASRGNKHAQETGGGCERAHHEGGASDTALIVEIEILGLLQPQATDMTRGAQNRVLSVLELCLVVDAGEHFEHARQEFLEFTVPPKREPVGQWRNELNVLGQSGYCRSRIPRLAGHSPSCDVISHAIPARRSAMTRVPGAARPPGPSWTETPSG
ncbi:hypothetical protein [Streptomyces sp. NPDC005533]|uniref:hypothetical protein n=1 Tax=Streptomyces sp. NPDC005533 TaxID=3364723 RepID=UPI0036B64B35